MVDGAGAAFSIVFTIAFLAVVGALLLNRVFGWLMEGQISGMQFAGICAVFLGIVCLMFILHSTPLKVLLGLGFAGFVIGAPFFEAKLVSKPDLRRFHDERIDQYRDVIAQRPDNVAARSKLADVLHEVGRLDEAIQELEEAIRMSPATENPKKLESWIREREERKTPMRICPNCGHANPAVRKRCENCEGETSMGKAIVKSFGRDEVSHGLKAAGIAMAVLAVPFFLFCHLFWLYQVLVVGFILIVFLIGMLVRMYMQP